MLSFSTSAYDPKASIHVNSTESDRRIMYGEAEDSNSKVSVTFMVPNGHYYKVKDEINNNTGINIVNWTETSLI